MPAMPAMPASQESDTCSGSVSKASAFELIEGSDDLLLLLAKVVRASWPLWGAQHGWLDLLFDVVLPLAAGMALLASGLLAARQAARFLERQCRASCGRRPRWRFGRKGLVVSVCSMLFAGSCFYRSVHVADEGAMLCRGAPSAYNAPVSGRLVATLGEIALVAQIAAYLDDTALRLKIPRQLWATRKRWTYAPVLLAEGLSWSGVLLGEPRFFCCEYVVWMLMAGTWAWDSAELLHKSACWRDSLGHASLLAASAGLCFFNACIEIPHFFLQEGVASATTPLGGSAFRCLQDAYSPVWLKRLPFFVTYMFGCSWSSVAISYHYLLRGSRKTRRHPAAASG
mmetsp:Transcript_13583/g.29894  ORF Transcript_13583/g.29894 Transcript_13583/m.29894 type:complete len:341 (-) Transcript_13583:122-1144(-)